MQQKFIKVRRNEPRPRPLTRAIVRNINRVGVGMKFRKKPIVIEASQWIKNGDHPFDNPEFYRDPTHPNKMVMGEGKVVRYYRHPKIDGEITCEECEFKMNKHGWIDTLEGGHIVCVGDWIITGVKGEHYPCKPDIFEMTYERVEE